MCGLCESMANITYESGFMKPNEKCIAERSSRHGYCDNMNVADRVPVSIC